MKNQPIVVTVDGNNITYPHLNRTTQHQAYQLSNHFSLRLKSIIHLNKTDSFHQWTVISCRSSHCFRRAIVTIAIFVIESRISLLLTCNVKKVKQGMLAPVLPQKEQHSPINSMKKRCYHLLPLCFS